MCVCVSKMGLGPPNWWCSTRKLAGENKNRMLDQTRGGLNVGFLELVVWWFGGLVVRWFRGVPGFVAKWLCVLRPSRVAGVPFPVKPPYPQTKHTRRPCSVSLLVVRSPLVQRARTSRGVKASRGVT